MGAPEKPGSLLVSMSYADSLSWVMPMVLAALSPLVVCEALLKYTLPGASTVYTPLLTVTCLVSLITASSTCMVNGL